MSKNRVNRGHAVPDFVERFGIALDYFSLAVRETAHIKNTSSKGTEREFHIGEFFQKLLPTIYTVASGEAVDLMGTKSPQLDVVFYDNSKNFPFYNGNTIVLPAEALLASIEVKSQLTLQETTRSFAAATALKSLKPLKQPLVGDAKQASPKNPQYRYFHTLFAYRTDLAEENWAQSEFSRLMRERTTAPGQDSSIDLVYVAQRGLINMTSRKWIPEDQQTGQALVALYAAIYNFMERENQRRERTPFFSYANDLNKYWQPL